MAKQLAPTRGTVLARSLSPHAQTSAQQLEAYLLEAERRAARTSPHSTAAPDGSNGEGGGGREGIPLALEDSEPCCGGLVPASSSAARAMSRLTGSQQYVTPWWWSLKVLLQVRPEGPAACAPVSCHLLHTHPRC